MSVSTDPEIPVDHIDLGLADAHFQDQEMTTVVLRTLNRTASSNPAAFRRGLAHEPATGTADFVGSSRHHRRDTVLDRDELLE